MKTKRPPKAEKLAAPLDPVVRRVRSGLYEIQGLLHHDCGGQVKVERVNPQTRVIGPWLASDDLNFRWESFCDKCKNCDCNGWATLPQAVKEAVDYFGCEG